MVLKNGIDIIIIGPKFQYYTYASQWAGLGTAIEVLLLKLVWLSNLKIAFTEKIAPAPLIIEGN